MKVPKAIPRKKTKPEKTRLWIVATKLPTLHPSASLAPKPSIRLPTIDIRTTALFAGRLSLQLPSRALAIMAPNMKPQTIMNSLFSSSHGAAAGATNMGDCGLK